jgi:hypothetical protein
MTNPIDLANRALAMAGTRSQLTSFTDGTPEALYCDLLYNEFRDYLLRVGDYDFSMSSVPAVLAAYPIPGWAFAYQYPPNTVRIRQLVPAIILPFDPQPIQWSLHGGPTIVCTLAVSSINLTSNGAAEDTWDSVFTDAFVRFLSSGLFFALENRIEAHRVAMQEALEFAAQGAVVNP